AAPLTLALHDALPISLVAVGLTLIYSLMRLVNFAHGEFLMLAMYFAFFAHSLFAIDPIAFLPINVALMAGIGFVFYHSIVKRIRSEEHTSELQSRENL